MAALQSIDYDPAPTIKAFIRDYRPGALFYDWIVGPVGSGKTTGLFFKLIFMASLQQPSPDGIRRTRAVIVRNTMPQLKDTTIKSWAMWFQDGLAGKWYATENRFVLKFADCECEVLFRPLDTEDDVNRVLSLEVSFVIIDEFVQIPRKVVEALSGRAGRYPKIVRNKAGEITYGCTNYGVWGSSNPDTEDNWWYDFLHNGEKVQRFYLGETTERTHTMRYFLQPSGLSTGAENLDYLVGGRDYYNELCIGKSDIWIKQFVETEWGFSISGKAVVQSFKPAIHISPVPLRYNPLLPLVVGFDPGLAGSALVFGQQDLHGRLMVLGELVQSNYGAERLIRERLKPYLRRRFPDARIVIAPDPAAASRSPNDESAVVNTLKRHYDVKIETNNRLPLRLDAIDYFTTTLTEVGPAFQIDEKECPVTVRALKGGWRFAIDTKKDQVKGVDPEKNPYSHSGDACGYLARYFHKLTEKELRYAGVKGGFTPPRSWGSSYHFR